MESLDRDFLAESGIPDEADAGFREHPFKGLEDALVEAEIGDAIAENASETLVGVIDRDVGSFPPKEDRRGHADGPASDEGDGFPFELRLRGSFEVVGLEVFAGDFLFDLVPADGNLLDIQDAVPEAELAPVADERGDGGQGVVFEKETPRFFETPFPVEGHALGDRRIDRASVQGAFGTFAEKASLRFHIVHIVTIHAISAQR